MNATTTAVAMQPVDYMRSGALIVAFVASAFVGEATWLLSETVTTAAIGAAFLLSPGTLLGYQVNVKLDAVNNIMSQLAGILLLCQALYYHFLRKSLDRNVQASLCLSKVISCISFLIVMAISRLSNPDVFSQQHLSFGVLGVSLWLLGNLVQLSRCDSFGGGCLVPNDRFSKQFLVDLILVAAATMHLLFIQDNYHTLLNEKVKLSAVHFYQAKMVAAFLFGYIIHAVNSFSFSSITDRRVIVLSRLLSQIAQSILIQYYGYQYNFYKRETLLVNVTLSLLMAGNLLYAYMYPVDKKKDQ